MKKKLSNDYDITVNNMKPIDEAPKKSGFKVSRAEFYDMKGKGLGKKVRMNVLSRENKDYSIEQIFAMKDGLFVLEIEKNGEVKYFSSKELNDLI
jgi:hypothetical protein